MKRDSRLPQLLLFPSLLITLLIVWSTQAVAANLTEKDVRNVIDAMAEMEAISDEIDRLVPELEEREAARDAEMQRKMMAGDMADVFPDMEKQMQEDMELIRSNPKAEALITRTIQKHGFRDIDEWTNKSVRVFKAQMALMSEESRPEMEAMVKEFESSPHVSKEVIAQMREQQRLMEEGKARFLRDVTPADKRVVAPFLEELKRASDYDDD